MHETHNPGEETEWTQTKQSENIINRQNSDKKIRKSKQKHPTQAKSRTQKWNPNKVGPRTQKQGWQGEGKNPQKRARDWRRRYLLQSSADLPPQSPGASASVYKGMSHFSLPIRSIKESCSLAEQHRWWINHMPCRGTKIVPEIERWIENFKKAKEDLIPLVELDAKNSEISMWYRKFLIGIHQLRRIDDVFT